MFAVERRIPKDRVQGSLGLGPRERVVDNVGSSPIWMRQCEGEGLLMFLKGCRVPSFQFDADASWTGIFEDDVTGAGEDGMGEHVVGFLTRRWLPGRKVSSA